MTDVITVPLVGKWGAGQHFLIDAADASLIHAYRWYLTKNGYVTSGRRVIGDSHTTLLHRLIAAAPPGLHVDHRNGNKLDNRRANLLVCTSRVNAQNPTRRLNRNNSSGVRGVEWHKMGHRWMATIFVNRRKIYLGLFDTLEEAAAARRAAEQEYFEHPDIAHEAHATSGAGRPGPISGA